MKLTKYFFYLAAKKLVPELRYSDLLPSTKVGIRGQLLDTTENELVMDFIVEQKGNTTHILNAVSPAFTCSLSFSDYIVSNYLS